MAVAAVGLGSILASAEVRTRSVAGIASASAAIDTMNVGHELPRARRPPGEGCTSAALARQRIARCAAVRSCASRNAASAGDTVFIVFPSLVTSYV